MSDTYDVLGLGCAAVDELLYVPAFPGPDTKTRIVRRERECGGLTATALVAAARLGGRCAYAAVLGDDSLSQFVADTMRADGIDVSHVVRRPDARPIYAVIVVAEETASRNIFFDPSARSGADDELPAAEVIRASRVLFVDQYGVTGNLRAIDIASKAGIPVVGDIENPDFPRVAELIPQIDHLIVSASVAKTLTGLSNPDRAADRLSESARRTAVVTCGDQGSWFAGPEQPVVRHQPAFGVNVVDTTGCGDVFHGAYAYALARGMGIAERIRLASAAASLKATRRGGQRGAPDLAAVQTFLGQQAGV
jgi:sulfofructose kinase